MSLSDEELKEFISTNSRMVYYSIDWDDIFDNAVLVKDKCGGFNHNALGNLQTLSGKTGQWTFSTTIMPGEQWRLVFYIPQDAKFITDKPFDYSELLIASEVWEMSHLREAGKRFQDKRFYLNTFLIIQILFLFANAFFYWYVRHNVCKP